MPIDPAKVPPLPTGDVLRANPFGYVAVVGFNGVLHFRLEYEGAVDYAWLDITEPNVAYYQGQTNQATFQREVTLGGPIQRFPPHDLTETNAADWVAFCNSASHPLHRKAGIAGPLHVKFWELENEPYRRLDAITYARRCVEFSRAMKAVDPTVQIIMGCYWVYHKALNEMLEIAGPDIDLINNRGGNIAELRGDLAVIARYNKEHQRNIGLCHSEYRANDYDLPVEKKETGDGGGLNQPKSGDTTETLLAKASRWSYGLSVLSDFLEYQDFGGAFRFANFTNYVDGWGENLINCAKSRVYPSAAGQAFSFLQRQHMSRPLTAGCSGDSSLVRVKAAWDSGRTAMIVFTLNLGSRPEQMTVDLSQTGCTFREDASGSTLFAASPKVFNQESMAGQIREEPTVVTCGGSYYRFTSKPWSATAVRIPR